MALLSYRRHRFPPEIIQHAIWLYLRFTLSYRDVEELLAGLCHGNDNAHALGAKTGRGSCSCDGALPVSSRFGAEYPQCRARDEMALKVEGIVDGGMHAEEALGRSSRLEALHFALSSSHRLMRVLRPIVFPEPLFVTTGQS